MNIRIFLLIMALGLLPAPYTAASSDCSGSLPGWACSGLELAQDIGSKDKKSNDKNYPYYIHEDPYQPSSAWAVCPPQPLQDFQPAFNGDPDKAPTMLIGNTAIRETGGKLTLTGNAEITRADKRLKAEQVTYTEDSEEVRAEGKVRIDQPDMTMTADHGSFWLKQNHGIFYDTQFRLYSRHARGSAETSRLLEPGITQFDKTTYTTCADNSNAWMLRASEVTLYQDEGQGVARHARLNIKGVPVIYTPYLSFPIDERRKSGFLIPGFGSSNQSGLEISLPYYFNLAPNYDATMTPRYLENRGAQLSTEFRYKFRRQDGIINYEILPNDDLTGENRNRFTFRDTNRFGQHLTTRIDYDRVSDKDYLNDLGDSLSLASATHLRRSAQADYRTRWWQAGIQVDDYQTIDRTIAPEDRPYERLPALRLNASSPWRPLGIDSKLDATLVNFDQDARVTADRFDAQPEISWPLRRNAFELTPRIGVRHTAYKLDNQNAGINKQQRRTTPLASLDGTLFLERPLNFGDKRYTHTLEPRLWYLYVKGENQEDIPLFDTSEPTFTYRELFTENRFNGADRMGDANQAALAVSTRVLDADTGAQLFRASVGELFYFANRNVTIDNSAPRTRSRSSVAGEMELALSRSWLGKADMVWDPYDGQTERGNLRLQYRPGYRKVANLSYRFLRQSQSQIDASILWPLTPSWHVLGRWYYDLNESSELETMAGIEYDSCCWGVRLIAREYIVADEDKPRRSIMFQFVLKGLARIGNDIESVLEDGILGYTDRPEN
ncbi:LPS-assembly protein LptD [Thiogranum longum]|nr:LPS assembly protein LptD [Thiogranum longum]